MEDEICLFFNSAGWKPRSDSGDPGSGPDPGTVANHPTGCHSHPWSWPAANAGSHAQWPSPALPLHSRAPVLISFIFISHYNYKACCSSDPSDPRSSPGSDNSSSSPNPNDCPCSIPDTNATFGPHPSLSVSTNPSFSCFTIISPCTVSDVYFYACPGFILHTSLCPHTTPSGKTCACPSTKCSLHPYRRLVPYPNPDCSVTTCSRTSRTSVPAPDTCLQPCPSLNLRSSPNACCRSCPCFSPHLRPL